MILLDRVPSPFTREARLDAARRRRAADALHEALRAQAVRQAVLRSGIPRPRTSPES